MEEEKWLQKKAIQQKTSKGKDQAERKEPNNQLRMQKAWAYQGRMPILGENKKEVLQEEKEGCHGNVGRP